MELENRETSNTVYSAETSTSPRPISPVVCKCGCGHSFQPRRKDQVYLNKQHADFSYNHNTRMLKNWRRKKVEKTLSHNDNILKKYFKAYRQGDFATCFLKDLKEDGFDSRSFVGLDEPGGKTYHYLYNYFFHVFIKDNLKIIKIFKV